MSALARSDFDRFLKNLCFKCFELLLQSRNGSKQHTHSAANPHVTSWFNLAIDGVESVRDEIKSMAESPVPTPDRPVCLEVFADMEDQKLSIEIWSMHLLEEKYDASSTNVYNHMAILLRSVLTASRTTPSYSLARQGDQTRLRHSFFLGAPDYSSLGRDMKEKEVASTSTPYGKILVRIAYRTSLILTQEISTLDSFIQNGLTTTPERSFDPEDCGVKGAFGYGECSVQESLNQQLQGPFAALGEIQPITLNIPDIPLDESILSVSSHITLNSDSPGEKHDSIRCEGITPMFSEHTGSSMYDYFFNPPEIPESGWKDPVTLKKTLDFMRDELPGLGQKIEEYKRILLTDT